MPDHHPKPTDTLADFTQDKRIILISLMAMAIGVISTFTAYLLVSLIALLTNITFYQRISTTLTLLTHHHLGAWVIMVPVVGGAIVALMARFGSDKIRGHGIPEALEAILFGESRMSLKVALLKPLSSAIAIGTGGPFGAEGPIIMTGGAMGSLYAQLFHLSASERKTLLVAGAAAGMAAIFATPVAAVLLAVELLLFEWRPRSFIPVAIAAAIAGTLRVSVLGTGPIFPVAPHGVMSLETLAFAFGIGIAAGLASALLTVMVYGCEDMFARLPVHWMWWPLIGGVVVGVGGFLDPRVLGVGYANIHQELAGRMLGASALSLLIGKAIVWSVALGSGTSGGVLAPVLMIGGALGALASPCIPVGDPSLWAMVSMASVMGGTMGAPLTAMIFTLEVTHDTNALPALMAGCIGAHLVSVMLLKRSILTEKVARRGYHISREYAVDPLSVRVESVMDKTPPTVSATLTLSDYAALISGMHADPRLMTHHGSILLNEQQELAGVLTRGDLLRAIKRAASLTENTPEQKQRLMEAPVLSVAQTAVFTAYPDELLSTAVARMIQYDIGCLPVVNRDNAKQVLGYLGRSAIIRARSRLLHEENVRGSFWRKRTT